MTTESLSLQATFGELLRRWRRSRGLSQGDFGELLHPKARHSTVSCWETGLRRPSWKFLGQIVSITGIPAHLALGQLGRELAVIPGDGRGDGSTYRLTIGPERAQQSAPFPEKGEAGCTLSAQKGAAECTLSPQKGAVECTLSPQKGAVECTLSAPLSPPFLPHPPIPLNPPEKQETFGLRPLSGPQGAAFRINLLLEEAGVPLPSPAQIGLWSKTLGGIEPLLELLGRLVQSGLANKREPIAYVHELGLAVIALSQLNRELTRRSDPRPQLADLAESDAIGQHAHQVAFVHRPEVYAPTTSFRNRSTPAPAGPEPV